MTLLAVQTPKQHFGEPDVDPTSGLIATRQCFVRGICGSGNGVA
jgi:hypothetical protein